MTKVVHLYASQRVSRRAKDGEPGKDAVNINLSPSELVYNADKDGNISSAQFNNNSSKVSATMGGKAVSFTVSIVSNDNCEANFISSNVIKITKITTESVATGKYVPASAGGVKLKVTVDGTDYYSYLPFRVNTNTFVKTVLETDESFQRKYTEISNKYNTISNELNGKASKDELREVSSSIEQTAREISLSVSEKSIGRRNLLVGSSFRRKGEVSYIIDSHPYFIRMNDGYGGTNCAYMSKSGMTQNVWCGAMWNPVTVKPNTKYTFSMMLKVISVCDECFDVQFIDVTYNSSNSVAFDFLAAADKMETFGWTLKKITITTPSLCTKLRIDAFIRRNGTAYMCRPMLEEGENYNGWTLSEQDYDYVGGNILDNTRSLEKSGNLEKEESEIINEGYEYAYAVAHSNNTTSSHIEMLQWNVAGRINDGQDYMFSFLAKGTGMVSTYLWKDGTPRFFVESSNNKHNAVSSDGRVDFDLTKEWKRYWVHYHLNTSSEHPLPEKLLIRCYRGNEVYICQPKLEIGATMTEFTERKTDLVDKASLKKAGIAITDREVLLYGEKVKVKNGNDEAAMFQGGKLNANLIDAKKIVAQGIDAKSVVAEGLRAGDIDAERATIRNLNIIGSSRNPYTRMSKDTNVDYSNNVSVITGSDGEIITSDYELKWDNSQNGRRITLLNYRWRNELSEGWGVIYAPEGKYFFEDGIKKSKLSFSRQYIELLGIGDDIDFYGWIVVNKVDISSDFGYGHPAKFLAYGILYAREENGVLKLQLVQKTFDGKQITVEPVGDNGYKFTFPSYWGSVGNFVPHITPYQFIGNIYVQEFSENYIIFRYSGRSSLDRNFEDASFYFSIQKQPEII